MKFTRAFSMPNSETFSMLPVEKWVRKFLAASRVSVDPFAGNKQWATYTNDLNPLSGARWHADAETFCKALQTQNIKVDLVLFDPPYSPRQISEAYKKVGLKVGMQETQNGSLYKRVRDAFDPLITSGGIVLSFGWNSAGMGKGRGYEIEEILLVNHGGGHNDTICVAEVKKRCK